MKTGLLLIILLILFSACTAPQPSPELDELNQYNWSTMNEGPYNDQISFATGTDLLNWTDTQEVLCEHCSVGDAVYKDGVIYFYFVDVSTDGIKEQVGLITSEDNAQTWSDKQIIEIEGLGNKAAVDPAPFITDDGKIRLYYFDIEEGRSNKTPSYVPMQTKIYSAISDDGINFSEEDGVRFKFSGIFDPDVIKVDNAYRMYVGNTSGQQVLSASSEDGLNFSYEGIAYNGSAIPEAFYDGEQYYLYTGGIEIATSADGKEFAKTENRFESEIDKHTADPSVIQLDDESYILFYKTKIQQ